MLWDAAKKAPNYGKINEIVAAHAAAESAKLTLPQTPEAYKVDLPPDFKPPEGIKFEFKQDDPLLAQARTMAHAMGISQENFSKLLGLYAGAQVASEQQVTTARNAEIQKLGTTGPARIDALTTFFKAHLGDADGAQFASRMFTAKDIEIGEKLIAKFVAQGGANFNNRGRDPSLAAKVDDATYEKMTYSEKKAYAEQHQNGAAH